MPKYETNVVAALRRIVASKYEDYAGEHQAPTNNGKDSPLYDVTLNETYHDDIYSTDGARLYSAGESYDGATISIIKSMRNRPKAKLKIYRAIPDDHKDDKNELGYLNSIMSYYYKFRFFKMGEKLLDELDEKYSDLGYDEKQEAIVKHIDDQRDALVDKIKAAGRSVINQGDWVGITKQYAVDHGKSNLGGKFKIITKTVPAKHLWTDGNSIHEWGYDPK